MIINAFAVGLCENLSIDDWFEMENIQEKFTSD